MKEQYEKAEMELILFSTDDIIVTSGQGLGQGDNDLPVIPIM